MREKNKKFKILRIATLGLMSLIVLVYIVMPVAFGYYTTLRYGVNVNEPPKNFTEVSLMTSDGISLKAWYTPTQNSAAVILVHGATGSREGIKAYAELLAKHGFGVLAFDMRGHGESEGDGVNGYGWDSTKDVKAAVEYLSKQNNVKSIGGLGLSLGGEVLLGASSSCTQLKAIVSEGATYRTLGDYLVLTSRRSMVRSYTTRLMFASAQFFGRTEPPCRIADSISEAYDTAFLFIAGERVEKEIEYNTFFAMLTKNRSELWIADDAEHTEALAKHPEEYEKNILEFFNRELLEKFMIY
jgi:esterase/lipase